MSGNLRGSYFHEPPPSNAVSGTRSLNTVPPLAPYRDLHPPPVTFAPRQSLSSIMTSPISSASSSSSSGGYDSQDMAASPTAPLQFSGSLNNFQLGTGSNPSMCNNEGPPLGATTVNYRITSADGQYVKPEIEGCIEKGWFRPEDNNWTCYRRNYFTVKCSYDLKPNRFSWPLSITRSSSASLSEEITGFAMCISATADNGTKSIELIQHTPKRDKGPTVAPQRQSLQPCPATHFHHPAIGVLPPSFSSNSRFASEPDSNQSYQSDRIASFERIQFKSATQNNGRRRAAQQFYHLMVDLYARVSDSAGSDVWVKVASRTSVPVVVRGRSPGHYAEEQRSTSRATRFPDGNNSDLGGRHRNSEDGMAPSSYGPVDEAALSYASNIPASPASSRYSSTSATSLHNYLPEVERVASRSIYDVPLGPIMTAAETVDIQTHPGYQYFPSSLYDGSNARRSGNSTIATMATAATSEPSSSAYQSQQTHDALLIPYGRFQGVDTSQGIYPV